MPNEDNSGNLHLRPAKIWPTEMVDHLRDSMSADPGPFARLYLEELYDSSDFTAPPIYLIAAETRSIITSEEELDAARNDFERRVSSGPPLPGDQTPQLYIFDEAEEGGLSDYLRDLYPVYGVGRERGLDLDKLRPYLGPGPRELPESFDSYEGREHRAERPEAPSWKGIIYIVFGISLFARIYLQFGRTGGEIVWHHYLMGLFGLFMIFKGAKGFTTWLTWKRDPARLHLDLDREWPLMLGRVVQAYNTLFDPDFHDENKNMFYGMVVVYTLEPHHRDDPGWLDWMGRRLRWLRDNEATTADETLIANRLEAEKEDATHRLPASVTGNENTFWITVNTRNDHLPENRVPPNRLVALLVDHEDPTYGGKSDYETWPVTLSAMKAATLVDAQRN